MEIIETKCLNCKEEVFSYITDEKNILKDIKSFCCPDCEEQYNIRNGLGVHCVCCGINIEGTKTKNCFEDTCLECTKNLVHIQSQPCIFSR